MITTTPDQIGNVVISASAGTGKTFQLSNRFLRLLVQGETEEQILATTFTRKAAGEILERILTRLAAAALDDEECDQLAGFLNTPGLSRDQCQEILLKLTRNIHRLRVGTMDSLFSQIARAHTLEFGLLPGWEIISEVDLTELRIRAIEAVVDGHSTADMSRLMQLVTAGSAPSSIARRIDRVVHDFYEVSEATRREVWERVQERRLLNAEELEQALQRLEAFDMSGNSRLDQSRQATIELARADDWENLLKKGLPQKIINGDFRFYSTNIEGELLAVYQPIVNQATAILLRQLKQQNEATRDLLERFDREFQRLLKLSGEMRFNDVTRKVCEGLAENSQAGLMYRLDSKLTHLLFDEFQDTSLDQWTAALKVASPTQDSVERKSFFFVGDVKQAIYGWRGGDPTLFDEIDARVPEIDRHSMDTSFRSAPEIIDVVNRVFSKVEQFPNRKKLGRSAVIWGNQFDTHSTALNENTGFVQLESAPIPDGGEKQDQVTLHYAADRIAELVKTAPHARFGVLTRKNDTVDRLISELKSRGVPASQEGGNLITDSAAVNLIESLLRLADHPGDTIARFHVAQSPLGTALRFTHHQDDETAAVLAQSIRQALVTRGYGPCLFHWAERLSPHCGPVDCRRMTQLITAGYAYQPRATLRATDFLKYLSQHKVEDPTSDNVRVMTIHKAKGLEFDCVVLPELDWKLSDRPGACFVGRDTPTSEIHTVCLSRNETLRQLLPEEMRNIYEEEQDAAALEAVRLTYVALTRAATSLYMIVAPSTKSEKVLPESPAGLIRFGLTDGQPLLGKRVHFTIGDTDWQKRFQITETAGKPLPIESVLLADMPGNRRRGLNRTSPTAVKKKTMHLSDLLPPENATALLRGSVIHGWFEKLTWLGDELADDEKFLADAIRMGLSMAQGRESLRQFRRALQAESIQNLLTRESYWQTITEERSDWNLPESLDEIELQVATERQFAIQCEGELLNGSIDRLVIFVKNGRAIAADVIDFKTDSLPQLNDITLQAFRNKYARQMFLYRRAVAQIYHLDPVFVCSRLVLTSRGLVQAATNANEGDSAPNNDDSNND